MATRTSYINAINVMLSNIGQQPTASLNNSNPQVALARTVLDQVSSDVQTEGWTFNRERDYPLSIDGRAETPGFQALPDSGWPLWAGRCGHGGNERDAVRRKQGGGGRLRTQGHEGQPRSIRAVQGTV